jgi:hypothetical protein
MASIGHLGARVKLERKINMKKGLLIVAAVLMLAGAVNAGEIKTHQWPCQFVAQTLMTITVKMDIGYWIRVKNQPGISIKLSQASGSYHSYDGCVEFDVESNFNATLTASIAEVPAFDAGDFKVDFGTADVTSLDILPGKTKVKVCAHLTNANLSIAQAGAKDVQVAIVTIKVVPTV